MAGNKSCLNKCLKELPRRPPKLSRGARPRREQHFGGGGWLAGTLQPRASSSSRSGRQGKVPGNRGVPLRDITACADRLHTFFSTYRDPGCKCKDDMDTCSCCRHPTCTRRGQGEAGLPEFPLSKRSSTLNGLRALCKTTENACTTISGCTDALRRCIGGRWSCRHTRWCEEGGRHPCFLPRHSIVWWQHGGRWRARISPCTSSGWRKPRCRPCDEQQGP